MGERHRKPRNGAKEFLQRRFFRPVPGLVNWLREPTAPAVGYVVSPSGLGALVAACRSAGRPILAAAAFRRLSPFCMTVHLFPGRWLVHSVPGFPDPFFPVFPRLTRFSRFSRLSPVFPCLNFGVQSPGSPPRFPRFPAISRR